MANEKLLEIKNLTVHYQSYDATVHAVENLNLSLGNGETLGLVGETGAGKTTTVKSIMRILPTPPARVVSGEIFFDGQDLLKVSEKEMRKIRGKEIAMIFQDPMASLNERAKVDYIISEGLYNFHLFKNEKERKQKVIDAMHSVGLMEEYATRFPHKFSGGQRQRIGIARALAVEPRFIIADEPISALDVSIRAQVLNLMSKLQKEHGLTYLFIAHDLSVMRFICDRIAVIHKGVIVELAETEKLFAHPLHPYTKSLLSAIPQPDPLSEKGKKTLPYDPSCHDYSVDKPEWLELEDGHFVLANNKEAEQYRKELAN